MLGIPAYESYYNLNPIIAPKNVFIEKLIFAVARISESLSNAIS